MKKLISVALALVMLLSMSVVAFAADTCIVAGVAGLCGSEWNGSDSNNAMTLNGSGVYEKVFANVPAGDYQFKVVYNGAWKGKGDANILFSVSAPCDVTITYNPADDAITYTGANVVKSVFKANAIYAVGNGSEGWLNGESWNPAAESNKMTEIATGIYGIVFANVPAGSYEVKFAADGAWTHSWGGFSGEFNGEDADIYYNGGNIAFTLDAVKDVVLVLDLSNFSLDEGGAKCNFSLVDAGTGKLPVIDDTTTGGDDTTTPDGDDTTTPGGDDTTTPGGDDTTTPGGDDTTPGGDDTTTGGDDTTTGGDDTTTGGDHTTTTTGEYYLVGYINGADYDGTDYKFVNGKVTATFTADSYVFVKSGDVSYMTDDWQGSEATSVTLSDSSTLAKADKLFVPMGKALTFTVAENADGTLTLSYVVAGDDTTTPGGNTTTPGGNTTTPGGNTTTPGGNTTTPGGNNSNTQTPAGSYKITAKVPASWTTCYLYAWTDNVGSNADWPGVTMTKGADGSWSATLDSKYANMIIAEKDGGAQTVDLKAPGKDTTITLKAEPGADGKFEIEGSVSTPGSNNNTNTGNNTNKPGDNNGTTSNSGTTGEADKNVTGTPSAFRVVGNAPWMGDWNPASDAGRMLEVSPGVYKKNFENVQPGNYELKITKDGTWDNSWGDNGNNFTFTIVQACTITVTFTLDGENGKIEVKGTGVGDPGTGDYDMISVVVLMSLAICCAGILVINKKKFI